MPRPCAYEHKPTFICNAHHMWRLAVEGTEVGLRNAEVRTGWRGGGVVRAGGWRSSITHYPGLTDDSVSEMASHSYFCISALEKKRKCAFPYWMQIVGSVFRGHKCECSDALHAQMSWRVLILGNDSFNLKLCFLNKTVMVTVCMCGWGMLGSTGKQEVSWTREWGVLADSGSPLGSLVTQFLS